MIIDGLSERQHPVVAGTGFASLPFVYRLLQLQPSIKIVMEFALQLRHGPNDGGHVR